MKLTRKKLRSLILETLSEDRVGYHPPVDEEQRQQAIELAQHVAEVLGSNIDQESLDHAEGVLVDLANWLGTP